MLRTRRSRLVHFVCALCISVLCNAVFVRLVAAQGQAPNQPRHGIQPTQVPEAVAVLTAYEMARNRGDLDAAASYFADDGTLSQRNTVFTGRDEIRGYLEQAAGRGRFVVISNRRLNGSEVTWIERPAGQNINGVEVGVQAVVRDGKIRSLVYNGAVGPARSEAAADGRAQLPALLGLASVVLLISGLILVVSTGLPHAAVPPSSLRGRLHRDLQVWRAARSASG